MTTVAIENLTRHFGRTRALDDISLSIDDGHFVSFLGPSGCGKSTTLRVLAGFDACDRGRILFDGQDVAALPPEQRDIGMVFQSYALFPHMTVGQNVAFGLEMRRLPRDAIRQRVRAVLDLVHLADHSDRHPRQLSGGQQQRVALARALVIEPRILLLDEPLANLDAILREEMRVFIRELQQRIGITTIYVTHDQAEAMAMSDMIVVMFGGRVAQVAPPRDLYECPGSLQVASFVGQANYLVGHVAHDNGRLAVVTPLGTRPLDGRSAITAPAPARNILIRPESICITPPAASDAVPATVISVQYGGNLTNYVLALADGQQLHVQTATPPSHAGGDRVGVRLADAPLWVIPDCRP
ncbi:Fe(3+) ions import ATP-binding protein FbpC [Gluconacetobacter sp. SXCC-1]|uniref:ABC transporter ATP-binding protein n=1 Tax=Komagataeibacter rhaeticus TaxID=215221 RepID=A0A181CAU2_9PROT|nr:ABC transporter ATP-binding protein [Komagataeibacter rhaeticus]ATU72764.1 ABC transporter ATP-binding protein [Komagataeibacter xylinus]EGG76535.1 Fe(3+) ions import ATP-binding protein FbpC [Gluconacetobacter sp. SXCC-1]QIP35431.1 ABC transporter ATP-binding protein [Komagataeibacter rhaeticus]QOC48000.1 ABC transporter ATP-binding protein [Komagataeibacter rhaeticus]WPP22535.1 ABC transporter ATP-binding protein [Komagataeibacter rhaeticus]